LASNTKADGKLRSVGHTALRCHVQYRIERHIRGADDAQQGLDYKEYEVWSLNEGSSAFAGLSGGGVGLGEASLNSKGYSCLLESGEKNASLGRSARNLCRRTIKVHLDL
jgi:hypothetical protein